MTTEELKIFATSNPARWIEIRAALGVNWYGQSIRKFAALWAHTMEEAMAGGQTVAQCAEACADRTDKELGGTADFVYGYALEVLIKVWEHGEELAAHYRSRGLI